MPMVCPRASTNSIGPSLSRIFAATSSATATRVIGLLLNVLPILPPNQAIGHSGCTYSKIRATEVAPMSVEYEVGYEHNFSAEP